MIMVKNCWMVVELWQPTSEKRVAKGRRRLSNARTVYICVRFSPVPILACLDTTMFIYACVFVCRQVCKQPLMFPRWLGLTATVLIRMDDCQCGLDMLGLSNDRRIEFSTLLVVSWELMWLKWPQRIIYIGSLTDHQFIAISSSMQDTHPTVWWHPLDVIPTVRNRWHSKRWSHPPD